MIVESVLSSSTVIPMGYTANGTNIYTSWLMYLITTSGDTLMQWAISYRDEEYCC